LYIPRILFFPSIFSSSTIYGHIIMGTSPSAQRPEYVEHEDSMRKMEIRIKLAEARAKEAEARAKEAEGERS
jgi:hypothetical protein